MPLIQICSQIIQNKIAWHTSILSGFVGMNRLSGSEGFGLDLPSVLASQGRHSRYSPLVHAYYVLEVLLHDVSRDLFSLLYAWPYMRSRGAVRLEILRAWLSWGVSPVPVFILVGAVADFVSS